MRYISLIEVQVGMTIIMAFPGRKNYLHATVMEVLDGSHGVQLPANLDTLEVTDKEVILILREINSERDSRYVAKPRDFEASGHSIEVVS